MREIIAYEARDGRRFFDIDLCRRHEDALAVVDAALGALKPRPDLAHGTYIEQDVDAVWEARARIIQVSDLSWNQKTSALMMCAVRTLPNLSVVGMLLGRDTPVADAWSRLDCIDAQGREWDQPYYAVNPGERLGEHVADRP